MRRVISVRPREYDDGAGGVVRDAAVSREDVHAALADLEATMHVCGGVLVVVYGREATDVDGEMRTNGVVLTWQDRTNAPAKPEQPREVTPPPPPARNVELEAAAAEAVEQVTGGDPGEELAARVADVLAEPTEPGEAPEVDESTVREQMAVS